jgi:diguanylate cyclase (GGDEF)-like protein
LNYFLIKHIIGRYGGEEFIICLPNTSLVQAYELADNIRKTVSEFVIVVEEKEVCVTSSFGISSIDELIGEHGQSIQKLMK